MSDTKIKIYTMITLNVKFRHKRRFKQDIRKGRKQVGELSIGIAVYAAGLAFREMRMVFILKTCTQLNRDGQEVILFWIKPVNKTDIRVQFLVLSGAGADPLKDRQVGFRKIDGGYVGMEFVRTKFLGERVHAYRADSVRIHVIQLPQQRFSSSRSFHIQKKDGV